MKIKTAFLLLMLTVLVTVNGTARQAEEQKSMDVDFSVGLNLSYNRVPVILGDLDISNTLVYSYAALEVGVNLTDYLDAGVVVGLNRNSFNDPVDFMNMPLSLRLEDESFNSMVFGLRAKSEFFSFKDFSFAANAEYLHFKQFKKDFPIELDIVSGISTIKNSFNQLALELWVQYDRLSKFTPFIGPQLNMVSGDLNANLDLRGLTGEQDISYKQKRSFGIVGGARFEIGDFDVNLKLNLASKTSLTVDVIYIF